MWWMTVLFSEWEELDLPSIPFNVYFDSYALKFEKEKKNQFFTLLKNISISEKIYIKTNTLSL